LQTVHTNTPGDIITLIPKCFSILGHTYNVVLSDNFLEVTGNLGSANHHTNAISVQKPTQAILSESQAEQTFWHEVVHVILYHMNAEELHKDEDFVDTFAGHLHQVIESMKNYDTK
jgi:hypothetical protein